MQTNLQRQKADQWLLGERRQMGGITKGKSDTFEGDRCSSY